MPLRRPAVRQEDAAPARLETGDPALNGPLRRPARRCGSLSEDHSAVPGDLGGYASLNVPRVQAIHSGPMYHTSGDVLDTISVPGLERAARFFAFFVREVARSPRTDIDPARK